MANAHRTNVLVTSCLKTPVDPQTKAPLASYERERVLPCTATSHMDNRDYEKELEYEDSGSDFCDEDYMAKGGPLLMTDYRAAGDRLDLSEIFFSNEEYYSKLEELKKAHLRTMAELESMYRRKLQLKAMEPLDMAMLETGRHRKVLEQRKKAEEEEEQWKERQKQREKKLQKVVLKRAQANDPHTALSQTHPSKLKEFRKQELQRRREYQQEVKEMQQRVKGRPLLLEQVAQRNAKQAAEKRYTDALHGCDLTEEFISSKAAKSGSARKASPSSDSRQSDQDEPDMGYRPVHYRKVFLDDEDVDTRDGGSDATSLNHRDGEDASSHRSDQDYRRNDDGDHSDESYHYSDDHENYSDDSEHDADTTQQEAGE